MLVLVMAAMAQDRHFESCPLEVIDKGWKTKTIDHVINGSIGIMLDSFNSTWPTWMVGAACHTMEKGLSKEVLDKETELIVTVDAKNGYVEVNDAGTDGEYMSACYWNRSNGHKLLAIRLGKPTDPCLEIVCFYDYDPAKKTLTPEPDILKGYRWGDKKEFTQVFCRLPKVGKDVIVEEWGNDAPMKHTFTWNGMKPVFAKSEPLEIDNTADYSIKVEYKGAAPNIKDFVSAILSPEDIGESLSGMKDSWEMYLNGMKLIPGESITVDTPNGYMAYESESEEKNRMIIECCFWNHADKKHKLVAMSNDLYLDGKATTGQYTGLSFFLYDNATRRMIPVSLDDLAGELVTPPSTYAVTHALPRQGKTIVFTYHIPAGKLEKRLTWNGTKFISESK